MATVVALLAAGALSNSRGGSHLWSVERERREGIGSHVTSPLPSSYVLAGEVPASFTWGNVRGTSYLTKNLNQHVPQYCGACWAHATASSFADRIKIARGAKGVDVNLAVQHILNCGTAGTCHGGSMGGVFQWIHGNKGGVAYDTCQPYIACSAESKEGFCPHVNTTCTPDNVCRTCSTFTAAGGFCAAIEQYPNATVAEYGTVFGELDMMNEIYSRGPVGCGINAERIENYQGGIAKGRCFNDADHAVSVVGWGQDNTTNEAYWIVRNSWGEYWGENGYLRVSKGTSDSLCLESTCYWATPKTWTEHNKPCDEDGHNCNTTARGSAHGTYVDPSVSGVPYGRRLK